MKPLLALLAIALLSVGAMGCGSASKNKGSASQASSVAAASGATATTGSSAETPMMRASDHDDADDTRGYESRGESEDDREVITYGKAASATDIRTATVFAKHYFAAAAAEDGATACSLLRPSLARLIPGSYGNEPNMRGKTCAEVMTKLFKHRHKLMAAEAAGLEVTGMRIAGKATYVLLAFKGLRERRYLGLERAGKAWQLEDLTDSEFP